MKPRRMYSAKVFRPSLRSFFLFCLVCSVAFSLAGVTLVTLQHREPLCTDLLDGESYDSAEGKAIDDSVHVVTWATSDSGYLRRLKASAAWQGYAPLTVLGLGTSWRGPFYSKLVPLVSFLRSWPINLCLWWTMTPSCSRARVP